jgi:spore germination protein GerM
MRLVRSGVAILALALACGVAACGDDEEEPAATEAPTTQAASTAPATEEPATTEEPAESTAEAPTESTAEEPTGETSEPATDTGADGGTSQLAIYLVGGEHVTPVRRTADGPPLARTAIEALLEGPIADDGELTTAIPEGTELLDIAIDDAGVLTVDLSGEFESGGGSLSMQLRVAQVVYTAFQFPTVTGVLFRLDGEPVTAIGGEGLLVDTPQTPAQFEDVTPLVLVQEPLPGDTVSCPVRARGTSNVFEATSLMGVVAGEDEMPPEPPTIVTATSGTGTRGTFDVEVACTPPEGGEGFLVSWWDSAKDGSPQDVQHIALVFDD